MPDDGAANWERRRVPSMNWVAIGVALALRALYSAVLNEPIPETMMTLLAQLDGPTSTDVKEK